MKKHSVKKREGSALLIAIVIMMVVTMLSLALLLVSYSLFATANKQKTMEQCKEMAQGISREIEREITLDYESSADVKQAFNAGNENQLWLYLRCNVWQSSWTYYNDEERGHDLASAAREFEIPGLLEENENKVLDDIKVQLYWISEADAEKDSDDTELVVEVTCQRGRQKSIMTSVYQVTIEENAANYTAETMMPSSTVNPSHNTINLGEKWTFSLSERE